jgi:hypothetical protein
MHHSSTSMPIRWPRRDRSRQLEYDELPNRCFEVAVVWIYLPKAQVAYKKAITVGFANWRNGFQPTILRSGIHRPKCLQRVIRDETGGPRRSDFRKASKADVR